MLKKTGGTEAGMLRFNSMESIVFNSPEYSVMTLSLLRLRTHVSYWLARPLLRNFVFKANPTRTNYICGDIRAYLRHFSQISPLGLFLMNLSLLGIIWVKSQFWWFSCLFRTLLLINIHALSVGLLPPFSFSVLITSFLAVKDLTLRKWKALQH